MEYQTMHHLIVKDKFAEQHILELLSYPRCNRSETLLCDSLPKSRWTTYLKRFP